MMEEINILISWIIVLIGIGVLIYSPKSIYKKIRVRTDNREDRKLIDRKLLLFYYEIAGILIISLGVILILSFSDKLSF